jgi:hypothetical protein
MNITKFALCDNKSCLIAPLHCNFNQTIQNY